MTPDKPLHEPPLDHIRADARRAELANDRVVERFAAGEPLMEAVVQPGGIDFPVYLQCLDCKGDIRFPSPIPYCTVCQMHRLTRPLPPADVRTCECFDCATQFVAAWTPSTLCPKCGRGFTLPLKKPPADVSPRDPGDETSEDDDWVGDAR